jgi:hypothetical protein
MCEPHFLQSMPRLLYSCGFLVVAVSLLELYCHTVAKASSCGALRAFRLANAAIMPA